MGIEAQRGSVPAGIADREPSPSRLRSSNIPSAEITTTVKKLSERFQSSAKELSALSQQVAENPNSALKIRHLRESLEEETKKLRKLTNDSQLTEQQRNQLLAPFRAQLAAILVEEAKALAVTANSGAAFGETSSTRAWLQRHYGEQQSAITAITTLEESLKQGSVRAGLLNGAAEWSRSGLGETIVWSIGATAAVAAVVATGGLAIPVAGVIAAGLVAGGIGLGLKNVITGWGNIQQGFDTGYTTREGKLEHTINVASLLSDLIPGGTLASKLGSRTTRALLAGTAKAELRELAKGFVLAETKQLTKHSSNELAVTVTAELLEGRLKRQLSGSALERKLHTVIAEEVKKQGGALLLDESSFTTLAKKAATLHLGDEGKVAQKLALGTLGLAGVSTGSAISEIVTSDQTTASEKASQSLATLQDAGKNILLSLLWGKVTASAQTLSLPKIKTPTIPADYKIEVFDKNTLPEALKAELGKRAGVVVTTHGLLGQKLSGLTMTEIERISLERSLLDGKISTAETIKLADNRMNPAERGALADFAVRTLPIERSRDILVRYWEEMSIEQTSNARALLLSQGPESSHILSVIYGKYSITTKQRTYLFQSDPQKQPTSPIRDGERPDQYRARLAKEQEKNKSNYEIDMSNSFDLTLNRRERLEWSVEKLIERKDWHRLDELMNYAISTRNASAFLPYLGRLTNTFPELTKRSRETLAAAENHPFLPSDYETTAAEQRALAGLIKQAKRLATKEDLQTGQALLDQFPDLRRQSRQIHSAAHSRIVQNIFSDPDSFIRLSNDPLVIARLLGKFAEYGFPIETVIPKLNLDKRQLKSIIHSLQVSGDIGSLLVNPSAVKYLVSKGLENVVTQEIIRDLTGWQETFSKKQGALVLPEILKIIPATAREKIIGAINIHSPTTWLFIPEAISGLSGLTTRNVINQIAKNPRTFADNYSRIVHLLRTRGNTGEADIPSEAELKTIGRKLLDSSPALIMKTAFAKSLTTAADYENRLLSFASTAHSEQLRGLLYQEMDSEPLKAKITATLTNRLLNDPELAADIIGNRGTWSKVTEFLSPADQRKILFSLSDPKLISSLTSNDDALSYLLKRPDTLRAFLAKLSAQGSADAILTIAQEAQIRPRASFTGPELAARKYSMEIANQYVRRIALKSPLTALNYDIRSSLTPELISTLEGHIPAALRMNPERYDDLRQDYSSYDWSALDPIYGIHADLQKSPAIGVEKLATSSAYSKLNPLSGISTTGTDELYDRIQQRFETIPVFAAFKKDYLSIVKQNRELKGSRYNLGSRLEIDEKVAEMAENLGYLNNSPIVKQFLPEILALPPAEQRETFELCRYAIELGLGFNGGSASLKEAVHSLRSEISEFSQAHLGLSQKEAAVFLSLDTELRTAVSKHVTTGRQHHSDLPARVRKVLGWQTEADYQTYRAWGGSLPLTDADKSKRLAIMKQEGLLPTQLTLDHYLTFLSDSSGVVEHSLSYSPAELQSTVKTLFLQAAADGHVSREALNTSYDRAASDYASLFEPIANLGRERNKLSSEIKARKQQGEDVSLLEAQFRSITKEQQDYLETNNEAISEARAKLYLARLSARPIATLEQGKIDIDGKLISINEYFKTLNAYYSTSDPLFARDLENLRTRMLEAEQIASGKRKVSKESLSLTDRVDFKTHFLIGKYPVESCQHFHSRHRMGNGLLSYVTDPNVRIVQAHDSNGKITARAILRLLEDTQGKPALFIERIYSHNPSTNLRSAMIELAASKAEKMGIKLYTHLQEFDPDTLTTGEVTALFSRGSRHSHVYTDAGGGLTRRGVFEIDGAIEILRAN